MEKTARSPPDFARCVKPAIQEIFHAKEIQLRREGITLEGMQEVACIRIIVPETPTAVRAIVEPAQCRSLIRHPGRSWWDWQSLMTKRQEHM